MKRFWPVLATALSLSLALPLTAQAFGSVSGENVTVPAGETRSGTYFAGGSRVTIAGTIDGDLVCAGSSVVITGTVKGDVLCAGQMLEIGGTVDGNVRAAGQIINLTGTVGRNVMLFGQTLSTKPGSVVTGDLGLFGQWSQTEGTVSRDIYGAIQGLNLAGKSGSVAVTINQLTLGDSAQVNGSVTYSAPATVTLDQSKISEGVTYHKIDDRAAQRNAAAAGMFMRLYWIAASLFILLVWLAVMPQTLRHTTSIMVTKAGRSLGWGAVIWLAAPLSLFVISATFIGIPLAIMAGMALAVAFVLSPIFAGTALAHLALKRLNARQPSLWLAGVVGVIVMTAVVWTPIVGGLLWFVSAMWLTGAVVTVASSGRAKNSATA